MTFRESALGQISSRKPARIRPHWGEAIETQWQIREYG
jgi:hypothetical protein